jgi:hypothetical protein
MAERERAEKAKFYEMVDKAKADAEKAKLDVIYRDVTEATHRAANQRR